MFLKIHFYLNKAKFFLCMGITHEEPIETVLGQVLNYLIHFFVKYNHSSKVFWLQQGRVVNSWNSEIPARALFLTLFKFDFKRSAQNARPTSCLARQISQKSLLLSMPN